jgi:hypothetical protein
VDGSAGRVSLSAPEPSWWRPRTCRRKVGARAAPVGGRHCAGQPAAVLHVAEDSGHRADKQHLAAAHSSIGNRCAAFGGQSVARVFGCGELALWQAHYLSGRYRRRVPGEYTGLRVWTNACRRPVGENQRLSRSPKSSTCGSQGQGYLASAPLRGVGPQAASRQGGVLAKKLGRADQDCRLTPRWLRVTTVARGGRARYPCVLFKTEGLSRGGVGGGWSRCLCGQGTAVLSR